MHHRHAFLPLFKANKKKKIKTNQNHIHTKVKSTVKSHNSQFSQKPFIGFKLLKTHTMTKSLFRTTHQW